MTPEEREELLAAYALGTLSGPDAQAVEDLVRSDRGAAEDLRGYHEVVDLISLSVPLRRADPGLRTRVMEAARRETRQRRRVNVREFAGWIAAAAACLVAVAWGWGVEQSVTRLEQRNAELTAVVESDAKQIAQLVVAAGAGFTGEGLRRQIEDTQESQQVMLAVTTDPQARNSPLLPTPSGHDAHGRYVWSESATAGVVVAKDLPPLPFGSVYQAWLLQGTTAVSAGTFTPDEHGSAEVVLRPTSTIEPSTIMVAVAPEGGSAGVGRPVVLVGMIR
ncbi:MAG: anti-sigma factor [Dehalococcoidia bacterium]|nr:anti-sigma factor [Dehalococcoidia bacterium]